MQYLNACFENKEVTADNPLHMKSISYLFALMSFLCVIASCHDEVQIVFGTPLDASQQIKLSAEVAKNAELKVLQTWEDGRDVKYSYYFEEAGEDMPFRVCVPSDWDGRSKLPLIMYLHGGWNDESSYLDQNSKQLVKLADHHGYILVSPLGAHASYGNRLLLPGEFGFDKEAEEILAKTDDALMQRQILSEKDVINVLEIVLKNYPVDRKNMFLSGHSMGSGGTWYIGGKYHKYWKALAPMSGPFVLEEGYPWENVKDKPIYITEGTLALASLESSRRLRDYAERTGLDYLYEEVEADHGGMVPRMLPNVFEFFNDQIGKRKERKDERPAEDDMAGYLLVYFKEFGHNVYMAVSRDGYTFTDVNNGEPVMRGDTLALQKGIRDPHIYRGPDNAFYMALTDLHIYARQEGYRDTEWEREGYGWGNNRALVLMKSYDLVNWTRTNLRVDQAFSELADIGCSWAPATIYDDEKDMMMITFTMRFGAGHNKLYYSYVNDEFTDLLTFPQQLFTYPGDASCIDSDITKVGDRYHLYYVSHDGGTPGVKHASASSPSGPYEYEPEWCDPEDGACEAPTMWKRIAEDKWVLMYDVYSARPNNMGFSETMDFNEYVDLGHFNAACMKTSNFQSPKHGAVVQITEEELTRLMEVY